MNIIEKKKLNNGKVAFIRDSTGSSDGRSWGIFRNVRVIVAEESVDLETVNVRNLRVSVIARREYDDRSGKQREYAMKEAKAAFNKLH